ncbi:hypothetical protein ACFQY5_02010 [Paeniroseomonas aquatica]|uniref:hypothetical protein n=1 Tax=Paeniroseomonas aquatica TaxID=373043 RepID=UPI00361732B4
MPAAPLPENEAARLETLYSYEVLDSACEAAFDDIARLAARLTGRPIALVSLTDAIASGSRRGTGWRPRRRRAITPSAPMRFSIRTSRW